MREGGWSQHSQIFQVLHHFIFHVPKKWTMQYYKNVLNLKKEYLQYTHIVHHTRHISHFNRTCIFYPHLLFYFWREKRRENEIGDWNPLESNNVKSFFFAFLFLSVYLSCLFFFSAPTTTNISLQRNTRKAATLKNTTV